MEFVGVGSGQKHTSLITNHQDFLWHFQSHWELWGRTLWQGTIKKINLHPAFRSQLRCSYIYGTCSTTGAGRHQRHSHHLVKLPSCQIFLLLLWGGGGFFPDLPVLPWAISSGISPQSFSHAVASQGHPFRWRRSGEGSGNPSYDNAPRPK